MPNATLPQLPPEDFNALYQRILALEARPYQWNDFTNKDGFAIVETFKGTEPQTAGNYGVIFVARRPIQVIWAAIRYETASGSASTLNVVNVADGVAKGSGTSMLATTFDLNTTTNTLQIKQTSGLNRANVVGENSAIALVSAGTLGSLAGLTVVLYCSFWGKGHYR